MSAPAVAPRIVVGVDGSPESARALRYAARVAGPLGATLDVVIAYQTPATTPTGYLLDAVSTQRAKQVAHDLLDETVDDALGGAAEAVATRAALHGRAGDVLVARADGAEMLVVGGPGPRGALAGLRLGSVAEHCVRHAACPVLVVRATAGRAATRDATGLDAAPVPADTARS